MFDEAPGQPPRTDDPRSLRRIREALDGLYHGRVTVVVQDGRIVQLERTDKVRFPRTKE